MQGLELPAASTGDDGLDEEFSEGDFGEEDMETDDAALLGRAEPPASDPTLASWTNPRPVFSLNGYFRVRANYIDNFSLRRIPLDRLNERRAPVATACCRRVVAPVNRRLPRVRTNAAAEPASCALRIRGFVCSPRYR